MESFAFGDRTIPIHARTLGVSVLPQRMWACTTVRYSLQWCTLTRPPLVRTHTSNPAFPTGGGLGGFVFFAYGAVGRRGRHPIEGAIPPPPLFGRGFDVRSRAWQWRGGRMCGGGSGGRWQRRVAAGCGGRGRGGQRRGGRWHRRDVASAGSGGHGRGGRDKCSLLLKSV